MNKTVAFLLLALFTTAVPVQIVSAQTAPATNANTPIAGEEIPEVRRYTTEIIIFAYGQNVSAGSEIFVRDVPPRALLDGVSLESIPMGSDAAGKENRNYELVMLEKNDFQLVNIYDRLRRLDAYKPLAHFGWTQPTYPKDETEARPLSSFITPPEGLAGELTLYLSRYLHLAVNLQLDAPETAGATRANDSRRYAPSEYDSSGRAAYSDEPEPFHPIRYRIDEDRIFRSGELRYFDHPKFGVLAKITRVEEPELDEPEEELPVDGELLGE